MTEPTTPLPESPYCRVRARVASIWADGPDAGTSPDWRPAAGEKVTLTPSIGAQLLVYDVAGPEPIIVTVERVECVVDEDGWLTKADGRPVFIAPTDDPLLSATGWTWTASIKGKSIAFSAPSGGVVDLALFVATPAVDAVEYVSVVQVVADYIAANPPDVEQAVADWLTANPPAAAPDATTAAKGLVRLAGDLGGTADAPTVPGLADKADATHDHTATDIDSGAATDGHVLTADGAGGAAWEAPPAGGGGGGTGSGIELVSGTVTLDSSGIPIREFYATAEVIIDGVSFPAGTAVVWRRTIDGQWGYIVVDGWTAITPPEATATAPTFTDPSGTAGDEYTIPAVTGVIYKVDGVTTAAGTYPGSGTVTVTAEAEPGWTLTGTASWTHTFSTATDPIEVTATAPTWTDDTVNGGGTWTTPTIAGVTYSPASGTATAGQSVTVTATANSGYTLTGTTSWTHSFPAAPSGAAIVQTKVIQDASVTLDAAPTPGNLLVVGVGSNADPAGFTYSHSLSLDGQAGPNAGWHVGLASGIIQSADPATITVTGMGTNPRLTVWELAGVAGFVDSDTDQSADGYGKSMTFTTGGDFTLIHIHTDGAPGVTTTTGGIVMDSTAGDTRGLSAHAHPATTGGTITWPNGRRAIGIAGGYA